MQYSRVHSTLWYNSRSWPYFVGGIIKNTGWYYRPVLPMRGSRIRGRRTNDGVHWPPRSCVWDGVVPVLQVGGTEVFSRFLNLPKLVSSETPFLGTKGCGDRLATIRNHGGDNWLSTFRGGNHEIFCGAGIPYLPLRANVSFHFPINASQHDIRIIHIVSHVGSGTM